VSKPSRKGPSKTVDIYCKACNYQLFKYRKGGNGALIKCFKERISKDYTSQPCICPSCQNQFARECLIRGTPAFKMIGGKVWYK
jgi:hypothetical protein